VANAFISQVNKQASHITTVILNCIDMIYVTTLAGFEPVFSEADQGCQIFLGPKYQNVEKYSKLPQNIPNTHKIFPIAVK
jgi:hypothetical protein